MGATKEDLRDMTALAGFANLDLDDADAVRTFQAQQPEFIPEHCWNEGADLPEVLRKRESTGNSESRLEGFQWTLRKAWKESFPIPETIRLVEPLGPLAADHFDVANIVYPYQRAVMILHVEKWRAAHCSQCGNPFVKEKKGQKYCSQACYEPHRSADKKRYWQEKGNKKRRTQRQQERSQRKNR